MRIIHSDKVGVVQDDLEGNNFELIGARGGPLRSEQWKLINDLLYKMQS